MVDPREARVKGAGVAKWRRSLVAGVRAGRGAGGGGRWEGADAAAIRLRAAGRGGIAARPSGGGP
jgi:hypothetical protein